MFTRSIIRKLFTTMAASAMMLSSIPVTGASAKDNLTGDINYDGVVNIDDLSFMSRYLLGKTSVSMEGFINGDIDNDNVIDSIDLILLRKMLNQENGADISQPVMTVNSSDSDTERMMSDIFDNRKYASNTASEESFDDSDFIKAPLSDMNGTLSSVGDARVCIFYVDFPDCRYSYEPTTDEIEQMAFADSEPESKHFPFESINGFYQRSSKNRVRLSGEAYRYTAKYDKEIYEGDTYKLRLIDEIMKNMDDEINFRDFDGNGDNTIDSIIISVPEAAGNENWWPCAGRYAGSLYPVIDGVNMGYIITGNAEIKGIKDYERFAASYVHELGHCMGLPDYYLYDFESGEGLHGSAGYDTMDELYADYSCASKLMLGWYKESQIQVYDYDGAAEQTFTLTDGQTDNGNCLIIPYENKLADDYCSQYLILEYTTLNNNNKLIPKKYWNRNYGSGVRILHVNAETEVVNGIKDLKYKNSTISFYEYYFGRRYIRVVNDSNIDNLFRTGKTVTKNVDGFGFYECTGKCVVDPNVEISIGELDGDSYKVTVRRKG